MAEMVFTGDRIPVERLHALGMINRLTEPGESLATALNWRAGWRTARRRRWLWASG